MLLVILLACGGADDSAAADNKKPHPDADADTDTDADADADSDSDADTDTSVVVDPPLGGTSGGSGGSDYPSSTTQNTGGVTWYLLAPNGSARASRVSLLVVISGTEGGEGMMSNMRQVAPYFGLEESVIAVLDGTRSDAADGAKVLDAVRASYDIDNDRTWLMSESAGTAAGLELAFHERPSTWAAYWANDVNDRDTPSLNAAQLGFAPWGNAGPGGDLPDANAIVDGMRAAGWQLPADAPYSGSGSTQHGSQDQFLEAVDFFWDKARE